VPRPINQNPTLPSLPVQRSEPISDCPCRQQLLLTMPPTAPSSVTPPSCF
jgi:hypothetical protein